MKVKNLLASDSWNRRTHRFNPVAKTTAAKKIRTIDRIDYSYRDYLSEVKQQISDMTRNGSEIRDTAPVLKISPTTVIEELKQRSLSPASESSLLEQIENPQEPIMVVKVDEAALDEMRKRQENSSNSRYRRICGFGSLLRNWTEPI